jgi:hypothetical protein
MIVPPLANQPIAHTLPPTREHHQFLLGLHDAVLTLQTQVAALEAISGPTGIYGPFYINDLPASATTAASQGVFNTATAVSQTTRDPRMKTAGRVIGAWITSDDNRVTGTATVRVRVNGTGTDFASGAVQLNATDVNRSSAIVAYASGVAFAANTDVGLEVVSSSWSPTTANIVAFMMVQFEP